MTRQVSQRKFFGSKLGEWSEAVEVSRREPDGSFVILGQWVPRNVALRDPVIPAEVAAGIESTFAAYRPAPKIRGKK